MLIPLEDIKAWLKITVSTYDDLLTALEVRVSAFVERKLRWYFGIPRPKVELLNGTNAPKMFLNQPPADGATVLLESRSGVGQDWTTVAATDFELDGRGLYAAVGYRWTKGLRNYRATYNEGFTEVPGDIRQLLLTLIVMVWSRRGREGLGSEKIGDYAYTNEVMNTIIGNIPLWAEIMHVWRRGRI